MDSWSAVAAAIAEATSYWVCTVRPDGGPHAVPVWGVWCDGAMVFSTVGSSVKAHNLRANPAVTIHLGSATEVVILDGRAEPVAAEDRLRRVGSLFTDKYRAFNQGEYDLLAARAMGMEIWAVRPTVVRTWSAGPAMTSMRWTVGEDGTALLTTRAAV